MLSGIAVAGGLACLGLGALGCVSLVRAIRRYRTDCIMSRLREVRAIVDASRHHPDLRLCLRYACAGFRRASWQYAGMPLPRPQFESVDECLSMLPDLVHSRLMEAEEARLLEANPHLLVIAGGELWTVAEEQARTAYLDGGVVAPRSPRSS